MINNFIKRAITGVLFVAILVGCILYDAFSFGILFTAISALTIYEFGQLVNMRAEGVKINKTINMLGGAYLFLAVMGFCIDAADSKIFIPYVLLLLYMMISELYLKKENPVLNWAYSMLSQLYIGLPFALLNVLAFHNDPGSEYSSVSYNPILPLSIFIFLWLNDTGAYCIGSLIGKHRLFERISPKKSWEGFFGGLILALASSQAFAWFAPEINRMNWLGLAATVVLFGTWGDLIESLLKRTLGVKDSGNVLPGHGGMLDRFDSVMLAVPASYIYIELFIRN
mgnify:FL=1